MNNLVTAKVSPDYIEALQASQEVESPAVGFSAPSGLQGGQVTLSKEIIKQNNTLIYLVLKQAEEVRSLKDQLDKVSHNLATFVEEDRKEKELSDSIADLTKRLGLIATDKAQAPRTKQGPIYYYRDPKAIFESQYKE